MKRTPDEKEIEGVPNVRKKKKRSDHLSLPPLDDDFFDVPSTTDSDGNPLNSEIKRDGRKRQFAHQEGNYPTHVYCVLRPKLPQELKDVIDKVTEKCNEEFGELVTKRGFVREGGEKDGEASVHISLSRPFALRYHQIQPLVSAITRRIAGAFRFEISMPECIVLSNDDKSRVFAALRVGRGCSAVISLIKHVDGVLESFGLPTYYEDPIPHASVAWALPEVSDSEKKKEKLESAIGKSFLCEFDEEDTVCDVNEVCIKSGAYSYSIFLQKKKKKDNE